MTLPGPNGLRRAAIPAAWIALCSIGCKPSSEPAYPHGPPPASYPQVGGSSESVRPGGSAGAVMARTAPAERTPPPPEPSDEPPAEPPSDDPPVSPAEVVAPEPVVPEPMVPEPVVEPRPDDPPPIPVGALPPPPGQPAADAPAEAPAEPPPIPAESDPPPEVAPELPPLSPATLQAISRRASPAERRESARLNREGLRRHKAGDYAAAIRRYSDALEQDPRAVYPRYNLACAYSLLGDADGAVRQLLVHRELGHADKLADARVDPDFIPIRDDARFRLLTGFAEVALHPAPGRSPDGLDTLAEPVRAAKYPVRLVADAPVGAIPGRVYFRPGAAPAARAVADALGLAEPTEAPAGFGDADVIVIEPAR